MDQELAMDIGATSAPASRQPARAPDQPSRDPAGHGSSNAIDPGPFLRQEGRPPTWDNQSNAPREDVIRRLRRELGFPSGPPPRSMPRFRPARPSRDISGWMGSLIQRMRSSG
jgi:hypothetical protein